MGGAGPHQEAVGGAHPGDKATALLREAGALLEGHFQLASGKHSPAYVEKFRLLERPPQTEALCGMIAEHFRLLSPEDRLIPSQQPAYGLHEVELERWEAELLPKVDGTRTVAELIHLAQRPEHAVYGFLYGMVALKIVDRS